MSKVIMKTKKPVYLLLGEEATDILDNDGVKVFCKRVKAGFDLYSLFCIEDGDDLLELLEALKGWNDYSFLDKKEFNKISKL